MKICEIVVTYNPDITALNQSICSTYQQVDKVYVIDNASKNIEEIIKLVLDKGKVQLIPLSNNEGIAEATNKGLKLAIEDKADIVLLSDQDTIYPKDYIFQFKRLEKEHKNKYFIYAPIFYDEISNEVKPIYKIVNGFCQKKKFRHEDECVFQSIASGMFIDINVFKKIGFMDSKLFIDYVDFEWCWRAQYFGYKILCSSSLLISHRLGDSVSYIGTKKISEHSPIRYYYLTRNVVYLALNSKYLNKKYRLQLLCKAIAYPLGYTIFCTNHIENFKYTIKGFNDGVKGKLGKKGI